MTESNRRIVVTGDEDPGAHHGVQAPNFVQAYLDTGVWNAEIVQGLTDWVANFKRRGIDDPSTGLALCKNNDQRQQFATRLALCDSRSEAAHITEYGGRAPLQEAAAETGPMACYKIWALNDVPAAGVEHEADRKMLS